jgi:hypothetical protein
MAIAASAFAASSSSSKSSSPAASPPNASSDRATPPPASTGSSADTSATAGGFTVGMPVKDSTGATIGSIASLGTDASGKQNAVIKMGSDQFAVPTEKLGQAGGAATINLTQAEILGMLHKGGSGAAPSGGATSPSTSTMPK